MTDNSHKWYLILIFDESTKEFITAKAFESDNLILYLKDNCVKAFCSLEKEKVDEWIDMIIEPFAKAKIKINHPTIVKFGKLGIQSEEEVNKNWNQVKWPMDDLPF